MSKSKANKPREVMNPDALDQDEFQETLPVDPDSDGTVVQPAAGPGDGADGEPAASPVADVPSTDGDGPTMRMARETFKMLGDIEAGVTYVTIRIPVATLTDAQLRERPITHVQVRMPDAAAKVHRRVFQALNLGGFRRAGSKHVDNHPHVLAWILDQISDALKDQAKDGGVAG